MTQGCCPEGTEGTLPLAVYRPGRYEKDELVAEGAEPRLSDVTLGKGTTLMIMIRSIANCEFLHKSQPKDKHDHVHACMQFVETQSGLYGVIRIRLTSHSKPDVQYTPYVHNGYAY